MVRSELEPSKEIMSVSVIHTKPSYLLEMDMDLNRLALMDLIVRGYGIDENAGRQETIDEYSIGDPSADSRKDIFLAFEKKAGHRRVVGSLVLTDWSERQSKRGKPFWQSLREQNPSLAERAQAYSPYACDVYGIVTLPELRGRGIAAQLIQAVKADNRFNPSIVVGRTGTVNAAAARKEWGMTTFWGNYNITPGAEVHDTTAAALLDTAYYAARPEEVVDEFGFIHVEPDLLTIDNPPLSELSRYSENIATAAQPLITRQRILHDQKITDVLMMPVISIHPSALTL